MIGPSSDEEEPTSQDKGGTESQAPRSSRFDETVEAARRESFLAGERARAELAQRIAEARNLRCHSISGGGDLEKAGEQPQAPGGGYPSGGDVMSGVASGALNPRRSSDTDLPADAVAAVWSSCCPSASRTRSFEVSAQPAESAQPANSAQPPKQEVAKPAAGAVDFASPEELGLEGPPDEGSAQPSTQEVAEPATAASREEGQRKEDAGTEAATSQAAAAPTFEEDKAAAAPRDVAPQEGTDAAEAAPEDAQPAAAPAKEEAAQEEEQAAPAVAEPEAVHVQASDHEWVHSKTEVEAFHRLLEADDLPEMLFAMEDVTANCAATGAVPCYATIKKHLTGKVNYANGLLFRIVDRKLAAAKPHANCQALSIVVVGAGPVGLRIAMELALLGARVTILEQRDRFTRHNILHLWDWVCHDLLEVGATGAEIMGKSFFHIGTRRLQILIARVALILGVEIKTNVVYRGFQPPDAGNGGKLWRVGYEPRGDGMTTVALGKQTETPWERLQHLEAHVLVAAGGSSDSIGKAAGITKNTMGISEALGVVAHFKNQNSTAERELNEFSWAAQFNKSLFSKLRKVGMPMENIVYYQGETHYFVCTPKRDGLLEHGVLHSLEGDSTTVTKRSNIDRQKLLLFAREVASFFGLPEDVPFAEGPGAELFDFSSRTSASAPAKYLIDAETDSQLLVCLAGDSLLEPFWPEGLGINRGFLAALDAAWMIQHFHSSGRTKDTAQAERKRAEIYQAMHGLSAFTSKSILRDNFKKFTFDPKTRYKNVQ